MHKRVIGIGAVGLLLTGVSVWNAQATPLTGSAILRSPANHSLVEKATCPADKPNRCYTNTSPRYPYCSRCRCGATSC
jgi:hypothetical protein